MFYAPEILSFKNKTELSMLYFLSTTNNTKRVGKKGIISMNINRLIENITHPSPPFSLRLYAYLLSGLVQVWIAKINICSKEMQGAIAPRQARKQIPKPRLLISPNLQMEENFIDQIDDDIILEMESNMMLALENKPLGSLVCKNENDVSLGTFDDVGNTFMTNALSSIEEARNAWNSSENLENIKNQKIVKKMKIDVKNTLDAKQILIIKYKNDKCKLPSLEKCYALVQLLEYANSKRKETKDQLIDNEYFNNTDDWLDPGSIEEIRAHPHGPSSD
ncbi:hypothetical protein PAEPH01_2459, partial [Pancytospora epiphaga]